MQSAALTLSGWLSRLDPGDLVSDVMWKLQNLDMVEFIQIGVVLVLVLAFTVRRAVGAR